MGRQRQDQGGDIASEQAIETSSGAVIIERGQLGIGEPECLGSMSCGPFSNAVERLATEEHILEQDSDTNRGSDPAASVRGWEVRAEKLLEPHPLEYPIDDGQGAESVRVKNPALGTSDLTWEWGGSGSGNVTSFGLVHS